ncbi:ATP-dependent Clp protease ATP-binding subunit ClpC [bacterium HR37]|jgi:ATP-dependent Clp protease ATP-binding subunit ClpA|nr:ATP-dependent Clp protease ATP-binding subunit ClpC [bacterium HR37]
MDYKKVIAHLRKRIISQDEAIDRIEEALMIAEAGLNEPDKPLCVLLFLGPTGVGKTETVKALAEAIHGEPGAYCRIDMSGLSERHYAASFSGSPPGYIGSKENNTILDKNKIEGRFGKPGILLLDEIEKAHPMVHQTLLHIFDNALLRLASGTEEIRFTNTIIIMTSNVGSEALKAVAEHQEAMRNASEGSTIDWEFSRKQIAMEALERTFKPEFINRIDGIVVFKWLTRNDLMKILNIQLEDLNRKLKRYHSFHAELTQGAKEFLIEKGFDLKYGARPLKRAIRQYLHQPLARLIIEEIIPRNSKVVVDNAGEQLKFEVVSPKTDSLDSEPTVLELKR